MPIRFSTEAANADKMIDDVSGMPPAPGPKARAQAARHRDEARAERAQQQPGTASDAGKPGKDINAAGFIKDESES